MKNVIETERGLTLKELRLQWYSLAGQCLTNLRQIRNGPLVCASVPECFQYLSNIRDTMLPGSIAHRDAVELEKDILRVKSEMLKQIEENAGLSSLEKSDIWINDSALGLRLAQEYFTKMGEICLRHGQFPSE